MDFIVGGSAAVCACLFTNPLEVVKTRMQLQGELHAKGQYSVHYKNVVHAAYTIARNDGLFALQKGLVPALWVQWVMNGMRFGTFQFAENRGYITDKNGNLVFYKSALVGGCGGVIGHFMASPLFLVKTHLQSQAVKSIAVGYQHNPEGMIKGLTKIYSQQGFKGLFRGAGASIPRAFNGSIAQLISFKYSKEYLKNYDYFTQRPFLALFSASMIGGVSVSVIMTPFDLIMTRLYNQPVDANGKGLLYKSYMDCVMKIYRTEGILAFYKGLGPMYFRLGPHSVLCLMFWDKFQQFYERYFANTN